MTTWIVNHFGGGYMCTRCGSVTLDPTVDCEHEVTDPVGLLAFALDDYQEEPKACECGAAKVKDSTHSAWCPLA